MSSLAKFLMKMKTKKHLFRVNKHHIDVTVKISHSKY